MSHPIAGVSQNTQTGTPNGKFWDAQSVATAQSKVFNVLHGDNFSVQVSWAGDTTGTTKLEMCDDYREFEDGTVAVSGSWTDITANAVAKYPFVTKYGTDPAGATGGPVVITVQQCPCAFLKFTYTPSGGSGTRTMTGYWHLKGL